MAISFGDASQLPPAATPNADNWDSNTETLSGNKTLTDASETLQLLNPGGADRNVTLPTLSVNTPFFVIVNTGTSGYTLSVLDTRGQPLQVLSNGEIARVWTDGTSVFVEQLYSVSRQKYGRLTYSFGCSMSSPSYYFATNEESNQAQVNVLDHRTEHTIAVDGTIDLVTYHFTNASSTVIKLWKNGVENSTLGTVSATEGVLTPSISVSAGDQIGVEYDSGTAPGVSNIQLLVSPTSGNMASYSWGGYLLSAGYFFKVMGAYNASQTNTISYLTEQLVVSDCTADSISWNSSAASATTDIKIWKNGAESETIDLTGLTGVVSGLSTTFSAGDGVALEYDAGNIPQYTTFSLAVSDVFGAIYSLGGDCSTATSYYYGVNYEPDTGCTSTFSPLNELVVPTCVFSKLFLSRQSAQPTEAYELWKNGAVSGSSVNVGSTGEALVEFPVTSFAAGDTLAIRDVVSTNSGDTNINLYIELVD